MKDRANAVQARRDELEKLIENTKEAPVLFHPNMASRYHKEVRNLIASLGNAEAKAEAAQILRSLIEMIVLTPDESGDALTVDLVGDLAGILSIATDHGRPVINDELLKLQPVNGLNASDVTSQHQKWRISAIRGGGCGSSFSPPRNFGSDGCRGPLWPP